MSKIMGIHDHAVSIKQWLDRNSSYTWLRAFEEIDEEEKISILATNDSEQFFYAEQHNLKIHFKNKNFNEWVELIALEKPDVLLFNICYYAEWVDRVKIIKESVPTAQLIARIHHDVRYLMQHEGFLAFLTHIDQIIVPNEEQENYLKKYLNKTCEVLPFSADLSLNESDVDPSMKVLDLVSTANQHPARNLRIMTKLLRKLSWRGYKCENLRNLSRRRFHEKLYSAKYFLLPALTEASGSRVLIEALKANCMPIVFSECQSAVELLEKIDVPHIKLESGLKYNYSTKRVTNKFGAASRLLSQIEPILSMSENSPIKNNIPVCLSEKYEIGRLKEIISRC